MGLWEGWCCLNPHPTSMLPQSARASTHPLHLTFPTTPTPPPCLVPPGASEGNAAHLTAVTRKTGESRPTVLDEESTGEFLKHGLTSSEGQACVAIHGIAAQ